MVCEGKKRKVEGGEGGSGKPWIGGWVWEMEKIVRGETKFKEFWSFWPCEVGKLASFFSFQFPFAEAKILTN